MLFSVAGGKWSIVTPRRTGGLGRDQLIRGFVIRSEGKSYLCPVKMTKNLAYWVVNIMGISIPSTLDSAAAYRMAVESQHRHRRRDVDPK